MNYVYIVPVVVLFGLLGFLRLRKPRRQEDQRVTSHNSYYNKVQANPLLAMSKAQKMELSWNFLYNITNIVLSKFSREDKDLVHSVGRELYAVGMRYEHVVALGISLDQSKAKSLEQKRKKDAPEKQHGK